MRFLPTLLAVLTLQLLGSATTVHAATLSARTLLNVPRAAVAQKKPLTVVDQVVAEIRRLGKAQGMATSSLASIEKNVRTASATTTDYRQKFFDLQKQLYQKRVANAGSPVATFFGNAFAFVLQPFMAQTAYASLGIPFGGYITYVSPGYCNCPTPGVVWQIFVALPQNPTAPTNPLFTNLLLDYITGSQGFLWHNIPTPSIATLGTYVPSAPVCWTHILFGCLPIPSRGIITPVTGSSPAP